MNSIIHTTDCILWIRFILWNGKRVEEYCSKETLGIHTENNKFENIVIWIMFFIFWCLEVMKVK